MAIGHCLMSSFCVCGCCHAVEISFIITPQHPWGWGSGNLAKKCRQGRCQLCLCLTCWPQHRHRGWLRLGQAPRLPMPWQICTFKQELILVWSGVLSFLTNTNVFSVSPPLSLSVSLCRPNTSATLGTLLMWPTYVSPMMISMWSALGVMTAGTVHIMH